MPREIQLTNGCIALVDDEDYAKVMRFTWSKGGDHHGTPYALANQHRKGERLYMHRYILDAPEALEVHHIDGNGLNNCRSNLKLCTHAYNMRAGTGDDPMRNIWPRPNGRYTVCFREGSHRRSYGTFSDLAKAQRIRDSVRVKLLAGEEADAKRYESG